MTKEIKISFSVSLGDRQASELAAKQGARKFFLGKITEIIAKTKRDIVSKKNISLILVVLFIFLAWKMNIASAFFWVFFAVWIIYQWNAAVPVCLAIASLLFSIYYVIVKKDLPAEQAAIYAYYFLIIAVARQIVGFIRPPNNFREKNNGNSS